MTEQSRTYLEEQLEAVLKRKRELHSFNFSKGKNQIK